MKRNENAIEYVESVQHDFAFKNINWPTIGEFNETLGAEKIDEFIKNVIVKNLNIHFLNTILTEIISDLGIRLLLALLRRSD